MESDEIENLRDLDKDVLVYLGRNGPHLTGYIGDEIGAHKKSVSRTVSGGEQREDSLSKRGLVCDKGGGVWTLTVKGWRVAAELDDDLSIPDDRETFECDGGYQIYL